MLGLATDSHVYNRLSLPMPPHRASGSSTTVAVTLRLRPELQIDCDPGFPQPLPAGAAAEIYEYSSRCAEQRQAVALSDVHGEAGIAAYEQKKFRFTHTFGPKSTTGDIFAVQEASVLSVLKGFDATVMAYGSTGAGKTHTMIGSDAEPGILPLALDALFAHISSGDASYSLQLSALELLEERCVDLLHNRGAVVLRAAPKGGLCFSGLKEVPVQTKEQLLGYIHAAMEARTTAANYKHDASSRSHFVVRLRVDGARLITVPAGVGSRQQAAASGGQRSADGKADGKRHTGAAAPEDEAEGEAEEAGGDGRTASSPSSSSSEPAPAGTEGGGAVDELGQSGMCLRDATSATLTFVDLAGSEAATQNTSAAAVSQGVHINKSLHWLKVAVHELAAKRVPSTLRNSALTRLLAPSLAGGAHVSIVVCSSMRPALSASRDAMETLAFGELAGRVTLDPKRRTGVGEEGQLGKLQALLVQMADDRSALATDAQTLREQVESYEQLISDMKVGFISRESLAEAEAQKSRAERELADAQERNDELRRRCEQEEQARVSLASQLASVEAAAQEARARSAALEQQTQQAAGERAELEARLNGARAELTSTQQAAAAREAELLAQRSAVAALRDHVLALENQLQSQREAAQRREAEAAALAESNSELEARVRIASESAKAKDNLLLLKHKMYRLGQSQRRPSTASGGTGGSQRLVCGGGSSSGNVAGSAQQLPTEHATQRQQHQHHTLGDERGSNGRPASAGATSYLTRIQTTLPTLRPQPGQPPAQPLPVFQPASHRDRPSTPPPPPFEPEEFEQPPLQPEEEETLSATVRQSREAWNLNLAASQ